MEWIEKPHGNQKNKSKLILLWVVIVKGRVSVWLRYSRMNLVLNEFDLNYSSDPLSTMLSWGNNSIRELKEKIYPKGFYKLSSLHKVSYIE